MDLQAQARSIQQINTKNNRVEALFQHRLREFDRAKNQSINNIEQSRLETRDFLKQVRYCHSDKDPLAIKLLGRNRRSHHSLGARMATTAASSTIRHIQAANQVPPTTAPMNGLAAEHAPSRPATQPAGLPGNADPDRTVQFRPAHTLYLTDQVRSRDPGPASASMQLQALPVSSHRRHRRRTPIGDRMQHFFDRIDVMKRTPGTAVVDSRETDAYRRSVTLSKSEWRDRRRQWDPLFAEETDSELSESEFGDGAKRDDHTPESEEEEEGKVKVEILNCSFVNNL